MVTRAMWAKSFQLWGGIHPTKHNQWALVSWMAAEGGYYDSAGNWHGGALWNPLNTTWRLPGSWDFNWVHVQNYVSETQGLEAAWKTLNARSVEHGYDVIKQCLREDAPAADTLRAVEASDWGTGGLALRILHDVKTYWSDYSSKPIGQD